MSRARWIVVSVLVVALAALGSYSWRLPPDRGSSPDRRRLSGVADPDTLNVLLITLDTTRWDRLGAYGDRAAITPNLDRLAQEGVLFEQAITSAPLTLPAHATLLTGLRPPTHGVRDNGGYTLDARHRTLATALKESGRRTAAFVAAFVLDSRWGLDQGFERYHDNFELAGFSGRSLGDISRRGGEVVDAALPWLDEHAAQPFFAWLHFYDPHAPYDAPEPFRSRLAGAPYAAEIAYTDWQVGRVLTWLDARGLADRTVVVVVGDHGESLDEHGESLHGLFVYNATTRVPLIVRTPYSETRGRRVPGIVRGEDVMPTVLELVGRTAPPDGQGRSLVPMMTGETRDLDLDAYSESYYPRNHYGWSELRALRSGRYKFIQTTRPELYDIERDPQERVNLYNERRDLAERLARALAQVAGDEPAAAPSDVDPETRERLAALGYIGSFAAPVAKSGTELADPKDKIEIFNLLTAPRAEGRIGSDQAIARLRKVTALDPGVLDAWIMLGNEYVKRGELQTALAQYQRALALNPTFDLATINLANTYRSLGNHGAAILGYRRYLERDPRNALVRYQLGEVHLDLGQLDDAQDAFRQALVDDMRVASARNALGVVAFKRGDLVTAEQEIRAALAQKPDVRLAHFNLALIAEQRGDPRAAMEEYQKEIDTQPAAFKAAFNLAKLQEQLGNRPAQEAAFRKALELNPRFAEGYFYLAKQLLDEGRQFDEAITLARAGLEIAPESPYAPLGHYVLADIYSRRGDRSASDREAARGRDIERRMKVTRSAKVKPQGS